MKLIAYILTGLMLFIFLGCRREFEAPVPYSFTSTPGAGRFVTSVRQHMEGVYAVTDGSGQFNSQVVVKWTYVLNGADTTHYLSVFTGKDAGYFNLEIDPKTDKLELNGYWRKLVNTETGRVQLSLSAKHDGKLIPYTEPVTAGDTLVLTGFYGEQTGELTQPLMLTYRRPLNNRPFDILAHRSGGRTSDLLPASENSVEIIKLASRLGATGIEIDVRFTKDSVPILYHDNTLDLRLIQKNGLTGSIKDYTFEQLSNLVRLVKGEKIPTLEEALETVLNNTSLTFVWLDTKYSAPMGKVQALQQKYIQKARLANRNLQIVIGLPSEDAVSLYNALPNKQNTPILCELDVATTRSLNASIWAPRWTLGPQTKEVSEMKAEGRTVFVWTLDEPAFIQKFISENQFDGILSNYSPVVAYFHYIEQN